MALIWLLVVSGFFMVGAQFVLGSFNSHFFPEGDPIGPLGFYWLFVFPFELGTLKGWRLLHGGDSLFSWSRKYPRFAVYSLLLTLVASAPSVISLVDALISEMYLFALYFVLRIYAFLLLRCARIRYYDDDELWLGDRSLRNRPRY